MAAPMAAASPLRAFALDLSSDESDAAAAPPPREHAPRIEAAGADEGAPWTAVVATFDELLCRVQAEIQLNVSPDVALELVASAFEGCCSSLTVLHDDGASRASVVEQATRFLFKTLRVRLRLDTDRAARTVAYVALDGGLLRVFEGRWWVEAVPGDARAAKVACEQWVRPAVVPPAPLRGAFRGALAKKAASSLGELAQRAAWAAAGEGDVTEARVAAARVATAVPRPLARAGSSASFATASSSIAPTPGDASPLAVPPLASASDASEASDASRNAAARGARRRSRSARKLAGAAAAARQPPAGAAELEARVAALALEEAAAVQAAGFGSDGGAERGTPARRVKTPGSLTRRWRRGGRIAAALAPELTVRV